MNKRLGDFQERRINHIDENNDCVITKDAVSYTHLDVYKRHRIQALQGLMILFQDCRRVCKPCRFSKMSHRLYAKPALPWV